ncbi:hypothetical protein BU24DRAFT_160467 [Aaosphaeria arxii CBS 175.79]|uniref:Uncharacterized protein n=1 Tax=Aaosphaeria arxii CBS 175.79 TaxID=1450172 RepID=A0A6A5XYD2_9PLEO|nr:uncharacterized protein BU24DRAFT_160467 [Aaosphaeria arxii CBS 175.79]KAF2017837.1 hypothetical protein BU24DRAFT_160467 [Aaosphaeria arxii CBS 175.79]
MLTPKERVEVERDVDVNCSVKSGGYGQCAMPDVVSPIMGDISSPIPRLSNISCIGSMLIDPCYPASILVYGLRANTQTTIHESTLHSRVYSTPALWSWDLCTNSSLVQSCRPPMPDARRTYLANLLFGIVRHHRRAGHGFAEWPQMPHDKVILPICR